MAKRTFVQRFGYVAIRYLCRLTTVVFFRVCCAGRERIPATGPLLICANHQSFLDPVLIGVVSNRHLTPLARKSLFRFAPFRWLIAFLGAIPLDNKGLGLAGLREAMRLLKQGECILIFPEGTRTPDGFVQPLQSGFSVLARRQNVSILPVGLDGAFDAWPRKAKLPRPGKIHMQIGELLSPSTIRELDDEALVKEVERQIRHCHQQARACR